MMGSGKAPALAILIGKGGKGPSKPMGGSEDEEGTESDPGDSDYAAARETLKKASGWDDDVLDALHEYVHACSMESKSEGSEEEET